MFLPLLLVATSCYRLNDIDGNGHVVMQTRITNSFTGIENQGDFEVCYVRDSACFVEIEAEENLIPYVRTDVYNGVVRIDKHPNRRLDPNYPIIIYVHAPEIISVEMSGSGRIYGDTIESNQCMVDLSGSGQINIPIMTQSVNATISGSGSISLSGVAQHADLRISGSGDIHAYGMPVAECIARISGSGNIYTQVSSLLDVNISGSGNVYYTGSPSLTISILGSGQVIHQ